MNRLAASSWARMRRASLRGLKAWHSGALSWRSRLVRSKKSRISGVWRASTSSAKKSATARSLPENWWMKPATEPCRAITASSAIEASHSAAIQPSVLRSRSGRWLCSSAAAWTGLLLDPGCTAPGWRRAKNCCASASVKRSCSVSISSNWPAARSRPRPRSGRLREPSTSWPRRGRCATISRTRLSTAVSVISSKSSRNSTNGASWAARASSAPRAAAGSGLLSGALASAAYALACAAESTVENAAPWRAGWPARLSLAGSAAGSPPKRSTACCRPAKKRGMSLSARSSVSQAVATPVAARRWRACTMALVLPKPAGARTSTSLTALAATMA